MTTKTIDSTTHRVALLAHLAACRPCASLFAFARGRQDLEALDAWRRQVAAHLAAERERREYDKHAERRLGGADREHDQGGFATLAIPFFLTMLFAAWLIAGPLALFAATVIFRFALFMAPPSRAVRPRRRAVKITTSTVRGLAVLPVERRVHEERSLAA